MQKRLLVVFTVLTLLLTGCVETYDRDGRPTNCAIRNTKSYKVYGKRYHPLASSKNYEERGVASWYGPGFHRKRTSSGERYNMYSMTAAHKTLPLSTYVIVTNIKNGKEVKVKVNDRGPFVAGRLIDLSYGAAKKLGMVGMGTTRVKIKAVA